MRQLVVTLAVLLAPTRTGGSPRATHRAMQIAVARDVRLEVLDWGGRGPALVFLAGFGNTAHVFDGFAPQFTAQFHVLAITRRGFGGSGRPSTGYDTKTLATDILAVLDSVGVRRATFVGHSFAGSELNWLGAFHADRVEELIYLDASYDYAQLFGDSIWKNAFPVPHPAAPVRPDLVQLRRWFALVMGPDVPDDEIHALTNDGSSAALSEPLQRGAASVNLKAITSPALVVWASPRVASDQYPYWKSLDSSSRRRVQAAFAAQQSIPTEHLAEFRTQVRNAQFVMIRGGRHYVFLSHPRQVADAMRAFLTSRRPQSNER
jgi:non-heme chloroperoxidase